MKTLTQTNIRVLSIALLLLRITIGTILFVAGAGKVLGWFGGFGMEATLGYFAKMGLSEFWTYLSSYTEFIGGGLLILGLLTRPAALALFINMAVAVYILGTDKFFAGGAAYPFTLMIGSFAILLIGPMAYSIDAMLSKESFIIPDGNSRFIERATSLK